MRSYSHEGEYTAQWKNTGLFIRGNPEEGYFIQYGNFAVLTEKLKSIEHCEGLLRRRDFTLLTALMCAIAELTLRHDKLPKDTEQPA